MVNYGAAFVIGWIMFLICALISNFTNRVAKKSINCFSTGAILWGLTFMVLNWIATL